MMLQQQCGLFNIVSDALVRLFEHRQLKILPARRKEYLKNLNNHPAPLHLAEMHEVLLEFVALPFASSIAELPTQATS